MKKQKRVPSSQNINNESKKKFDKVKLSSKPEINTEMMKEYNV